MKLCFGVAFAILCAANVYGATTDTSDHNNTIQPNEEYTNLLSEITHYTKEGDMIDISLSKELNPETCYVQPPNREMITDAGLEMEGVTVQPKSNFVSCRISVGPISDDLIGDWKLCGQSDGKMRCQPVNIRWNNEAKHSDDWIIYTRHSIKHPVHFGGAINSGVSDLGNIGTCHVITPAGEDLVITTDTAYPHIERNALDNPSLCSIIIKDVTDALLGDWIIYSRFRSMLGQNEIRLPMNLYLYNANNPFEQAYNVTVLEDKQHLVNMGTEVSLQVSKSAGVAEDCIYTTPSGETFNQNDQTSKELKGFSLKSSKSAAVCELVLDPITEESAGEWQIIGKFSNGVLHDEILQTFKIIIEDPENPMVEDVNRVIQDLPSQDVLVAMPSNHRIVIESNIIIAHESCLLITPQGLQYTLMAGFDIPGVEIINEQGVECGVSLSLTRQDMIGEWILLARATMASIPIERRYSYNIRVEEVFTIHNDINIREGADLYLHLQETNEAAVSCRVYGPDGNEYTNLEADPMYSSSCGYIVRHVDHNHNGTWSIEYGDNMKFRGLVEVIVLDFQEVTLNNTRWATGDLVDITVGPEDAIYCKIEDSKGHIVFDNFGQCKIFVERVTIDHRGTWKMFIGVPGKVLLQEYAFYVDVYARDGKPLVSTSVARNAPSVMLTCSVPVEHEVHACKFRDPKGTIMVASHSVGEDGYMFNDATVNYESDAHSHDCTLRLTNPSALDLGIWRCAMETNTGTYYGYLTVVCPFLMQDPEVAASIVTEPVLEAETSPAYLEDEPVTLSCSIPTPLRYCYFRARNGTIFNVFPSMSPQSFEYVGAGLDAGDCGIRFSSLAAAESGRWTCHVGLVDSTAEELQAEITVDVRAKMSVRQYWHELEPVLVIEAIVYDQHPLDYCRFVKINGQGFTSENVPERYKLVDGMQNGHCTLHIFDADIIDLHPWTIAAKLSGQVGEVSRAPTEMLLAPPPDSGIGSVRGDILFWTLIISICIVPLVIAAALIPKKNREWTSKRASHIRISFRNSWDKTWEHTIEKKPVEQQQVV